MRNLTPEELHAVAGGMDGTGILFTALCMALYPTPLVLGVGAVTLLVYGLC
jgi:hypothetical protein